MAPAAPEPIEIACPSCGLSRSYPATTAPGRLPHHCPRCGADLVADGLLEPAAAVAPGAMPADAIPELAAPVSAVDEAARFPAPSPWEAAGVAALAALLAWSQATHGFLAAIVSGADLVFHEAGHPLLAVFGSKLLTSLGGTIAQLAIPAAAAVAFARRGATAALAVALVWLGFNLVNVGTYAADAMDRALPLLAPDVDSHDWWNILGMLGVRERCRGIGGTISAAGWALWAGAPAWLGWRRWRAGRVPR